MEMCSACQAIEINKRSAPVHDNLRQLEGQSRSYRPFAQARVDIRAYRCESCGTNWEYEDDKNDPYSGWRLVK